jgi:hypothetical protein
MICPVCGKALFENEDICLAKAARRIAELERTEAIVNQLRSVLQSLEPWTGLPVAAVLTVLREKVK